MKTFRAFRFALPTTVALLAAGCADTPTPTAVPADARMQNGAAAAPASYIVVFKDDVADPAGMARSMGSANGFRPTFVYTAALKGFAARLPEPAREALSRNPNVDFIEPDGVVTKSQLISRSTTLGTVTFWGLDRIDTRARTYDNTITAQNQGEGVEVYILDTGIHYTHQEFGGRAKPFFDAFTDGRNGADCDGHGTHVAGTVGGNAAGVAPKVTLYSVRVLDCTGSGSWSGVIAGVDSVANRKRANPSIPMVGNMSLGGGLVSSLNTAVTNAVNAGVVMAVAAGNDNGANACNYSPAATPAALTVGSTMSTDARSSFSNIGTCVDLFAPGSSINSAAHTSNTGYISLSGTSMAAPHVAGVAALYLSANPTASASVVNTAITSAATPNVVTSAGTGSPNLLLYTGFTPPELYALTVTAPTNGTITGTGINCGTDCTESILSGASITLTATPAAGFRFTGWSGACTNTTGTCTVIMTQDRTVSANFAPLPPLHIGSLTTSRTVAKNGSWSASVNVLVHDAAEARIGGATVTVRWTIGTTTATGSCTTSTSSSTLGSCTITRSSIGSTIPSVTVAVTNITRTGNSYNPAANHFSNGTLITAPVTITR